MDFSGRRRSSSRLGTVVLAFLTLVLPIFTSLASAQSAATTPKPALQLDVGTFRSVRVDRPAPRSGTGTPRQVTVYANLEIEVHAGAAVGNNPTSGRSTLPAAGASFTIVSERTSRRVTSWLFGDGAALLNEIAGSPFGNVGWHV